MVTVVVLLALIVGGFLGTTLTLAVARAAAHTRGRPSPALRHLTGLREQLQTEHAVALASSDTRASIEATYGWGASIVDVPEQVRYSE
jgi:hypothetical protein